jgi:hypothetical protein
MINTDISTSDGVTTITRSASSAGTYIAGIKYDATSVVGFSAHRHGAALRFHRVADPGLPPDLFGKVKGEATPVEPCRNRLGKLLFRGNQIQLLT